VRDILKYWDLEESSITKVTDTTWKVDNQYFLKKKDNERSIYSNIAIMKTLKDYGVPVASTIPSVSGKDYVSKDNEFYMMTEMLSGNHIDARIIMDSQELAEKVGKIIGELQQGLVGIRDDFDFFDNNFLDEIDGWIKDEVTTKGKSYFAFEKFDLYYSRLHEIYPSLRRQPIHRDVHLGNMLFDGDELVGYIDFDISQINARVFDLAYMAAGILAQIFEDNEYRDKWYGFYNNFITGFKKVTELDEIEELSIPLMMESIEILFVAYYLSIGDSNSARTADSVLEWISSSNFD
jgi:Ser/Thr protein kinase RdoA (MazF antagonist)